jgi:hypothetical protein
MLEYLAVLQRSNGLAGPHRLTAGGAYGRCDPDQVLGTERASEATATVSVRTCVDVPASAI